MSGQQFVNSAFMAGQLGLQGSDFGGTPVKKGPPITGTWAIGYAGCYDAHCWTVKLGDNEHTLTQEDVVSMARAILAATGGDK